MRAVKSVLVAAGQLKRKEPGSNEDLLLIRAMRDSNVPKFLEHDLPLFHGIVCDLFPGVVVPYVDYGVLQEAIETVLQEEQLQKVPSFISKIIQVHETQLVRHGMMVVGEAGSGKSANVTVLAKALTRLHSDGVEDRDGFYKQVDRLHLNPKSITAGEGHGFDRRCAPPLPPVSCLRGAPRPWKNCSVGSWFIVSINEWFRLERAHRFEIKTV